MSESRWRPRFSERDLALLHTAVYCYQQREGGEGADREIDELLDRIESGHTEVFVRSRASVGESSDEEPAA